jgi:hypothetical protein
MAASSATGDKPDLGKGMVAVAFGNDQMAPAREVFEFSKNTMEPSQSWEESLMGNSNHKLK